MQSCWHVFFITILITYVRWVVVNNVWHSTLNQIVGGGGNWRGHWFVRSSSPLLQNRWQTTVFRSDNQSRSALKLNKSTASSRFLAVICRRLEEVHLVPMMSDMNAVPVTLLKLVHCNCTINCTTSRCSRRKYGLLCSSACGSCQIQSCDNVYNKDEDTEDDCDD